jgi:hypothetical protein
LLAQASLYNHLV